MAFLAGGGGVPIDLPRSGRSSEETLNNALNSYLSGFSSLDPVIDFDKLEALKSFWVYNPDFSQYVANIVNLGNPGHSLSVDAATDAKAEAAVTRLNEAAARIYAEGGTDALIDQYLTSLAWSGAISSEDVVNLAGRRVERVVEVPVERIRFKYDKETDTYKPYQRSTNLLGSSRANELGLIPLNTETYKYFALSRIQNSPYAKPPATAAIEPILESQKPIMENIRWIAKKFGILGLVAIGVAPIRQKGGETDEEYKRRFQDHITGFAESLDGNFNKGLIVLPKPNTIDTTNVAGEAKGFDEINKVSEQQVFSGMAAQPGFHGRTDSTTETFADVVYYLLTAQTAKMQRVAKRRMERTYMLDLRLGGIDVDGVSLAFDKAHSRNAKAEAETDEIRFRDTLARIKAGAITADEGAQALGYESWADEELLFVQSGVSPVSSQQSAVGSQQKKTLRLMFDKASQRYRYKPDRYEIWTGGQDGEAISNFESEISNVFPIKKKAMARSAGA